MSRPPLLVSGQTLDRFKILKQLGAGGFGEVYLAIGIDDSRDVAVKILRKDIPDSEGQLQAFQQEIDLYKAISHPNVVNFIAQGETEHFHYVVLEHIQGMSLRRKLNREGPAGFAVNFSWMQELALTLYATHQKNIIHRDVKPENIMITKNLEIKLIDFGIARSAVSQEAEEEKSFMRDGGDADASLCTLAYASPEQLLGRPVDFRTDIFSLGLVFYEMMTGRTLIQDVSSSRAVLRQHMMLEGGKRKFLLDIDYDDSSLVEAIEELIRSMLRFDPDRRCTSTGDLVVRMQKIADSAGGAIQLISQDESRRLGQREIIDTHFWNAMSFLHERKLFEAVDELSKVSAFAMAVDRASLPALIRELDIIFINIKPGGKRSDDRLCVKSDDFQYLLNRMLDVYASLCSPEEILIRERLICERVRRLLDDFGYERFLQEQTVNRPHSHTFASAYVQFIHGKNPEIAKRIWSRLLLDLLNRELLVEAEREKRKIEEIFGGRIVEKETIEYYRQCLERRDRERTTFQQAVSCLENSVSAKELIKLCRHFLERYPRDIEALQRLRRLQLKLERFSEATHTLFLTGLAHLVSGRMKDAVEVFLRVMEENPKHESATISLYTCRLLSGREIPSSALVNYRSLQSYIHKTFGIVAPELEKLEARLTGGPGDISIFEDCVSLLKKRKRHRIAARYLVRLGALVLKTGDSRRAKEIFDEAVRLDKASSSIYRRLMTVQGIRRIYNPMELSRKAASSSRTEDSDSLVDILRRKSVDD